MLELCSEHDAQRLHDCINTHPSTSPSSPQGTMAKGESAQGPIAGTRNLQDLRAVFGGCVEWHARVLNYVVAITSHRVCAILE